MLAAIVLGYGVLAIKQIVQAQPQGGIGQGIPAHSGVYHGVARQFDSVGRIGITRIYITHTGACVHIVGDERAQPQVGGATRYVGGAIAFARDAVVVEVVVFSPHDRGVGLQGPAVRQLQIEASLQAV